MNKECKMKKGFTLAEVLITLLVIGVVAAITIPALMTKIQDTVLAKQSSTAKAKIAEGFNQMRVDGKLMETYDSTEDFVKAMRSYFKINQECNMNSLTNCFVSSFDFYNTTKNSDGKEVNGETTTKELTFKEGKDIDSSVYTDYMNFVGIKFADGVNMLISYKRNCVGPKEGDTSANGDIGAFATCFGYFIDVNADKTPNTKGKDIISNMAFAEEGVLLVNGDGKPTPMTKAECEELVKTDSEFKSLIQYDTYGCYNGDDYWAGAVYACKEKGMRLPNESELEAIASELGCSGTYGSCPTPTVSPYKELWDKNGGYILLWSSIPGFDNSAYAYNYDANDSYISNDPGRTDLGVSAMCVR